MVAQADRNHAFAKPDYEFDYIKCYADATTHELGGRKSTYKTLVADYCRYIEILDLSSTRMQENTYFKGHEDEVTFSVGWKFGHRFVYDEYACMYSLGKVLDLCDAGADVTVGGEVAFNEVTYALLHNTDGLDEESLLSGSVAWEEVEG
jgi:hypothetical protein